MPPEASKTTTRPGRRSGHEPPVVASLRAILNAKHRERAHRDLNNGPSIFSVASVSSVVDVKLNANYRAHRAHRDLNNGPSIFSVASVSSVVGVKPTHYRAAGSTVGIGG
jgi:hypothetical protein